MIKYRVVKKGDLYYPQEKMFYLFWVNLLTSQVQACALKERAEQCIEEHAKKDKSLVVSLFDRRGNKYNPLIDR